MIRVVIFNHQRNRDARALANGFRPFAPVLAIDSGSTFGPGDADWFNVRLPNVFYGGLFNAAVAACADLNSDDVMYVVCSDITIRDPRTAIERATYAFADARTGVYGPSATGTSFPMMRNHGTGSLRDAPFVEGFCLAMRLHLARAMAPVDTAVNVFGWGIDVHLAWRARVGGYRCVVDDGIEVEHDFGAGYAHGPALAQMHRWIRTLPYGARRGHRLLFRSFSQTPLGLWRLRFEPWQLFRAAARLEGRPRA